MIRVGKSKRSVFKKFPNNETSVDVDFIKYAMGKIEPDENGLIKIEVLWKYEDDSEIFKLLLLKESIMKNYENGKPYQLILNVPYLPYSRMDRDEENSIQPFSLNILYEVLLKGFDVIKTKDIHSKVLFEKEDSIRIKNEDIVPKMLMKAILKNNDLDGVNIVFPDEGALNRYRKEILECEMSNGFIDSSIEKSSKLVLNKVRDFDTGRITSVVLTNPEQILENKPFYVIDDLCSYGGTFTKGIKEVFSHYEGETKPDAYLVVAHLENVVYLGEVLEHYKKIYTTDSIHDIENKKESVEFIETFFE